MSDNKELSVEYIEKVSSDFSEQKEVFISVPTKDGIEKVTLTIDKYFHPAKIKSCVKELFQKLDHLRKYLKDDKSAEDVLQCWLLMLLIKHFSSLDIPYDFKKQIAVLDKLIETNILFQIFSNFSTSEIEKIMIELNEIATDTMFKIDELEDTFRKLDIDHQNSQEKIKQIIEGK